MAEHTDKYTPDSLDSDANNASHTGIEAISPHEPDWRREQLERWWEPSKQLLASIRGYQRNLARNSLFGKIASKVFVLKHRFWSVVSGADIPINCT
ncbi:MAG: hypothetical protein WBG48_04150, partial [Pricia sp.]